MSNTEKITCDWEGCTKEYAYLLKGFNLCAKHCAEFTDTHPFSTVIWKDDLEPPRAPQPGKLRNVKEPRAIVNGSEALPSRRRYPASGARLRRQP